MLCKVDDGSGFDSAKGKPVNDRGMIVHGHGLGEYKGEVKEESEAIQMA